MKKYIADSAVFIMGNCPVAAADMVTIPQVEDEMKSEDAALRYDLSKAEGLMVEAVVDTFTDAVKEQAAQTRDIEKLSRTDLGVLAKALEYKEKIGDDAVLITDDFAVQNIATRLGIVVMPVAQRVIKDQIVWQKQCIGCFRHFKDGEECPVCGSPLRKKMKKKVSQKPKTI
ncbi:NOB1 family endonuclease [Methanimicrococcus blatticola]|uniref:UPF0271 protein n=1 Tax=Methanimicrococcus blatticola TaxID=91560 RepID=A0A484F639_9EURY|nr:NOB1 family endonuclease [Methanimicrococcus blatticola]MBZ3935167.1 NOB1 family endonuclease [Methanimicrococcus blatticola]MCC2508736.1 NOB1 family endonuclease [Methanimicrococcus blatticola]TDQ71229.1 UPF0271 protein [Methanimicrococcus blatticola]